MEQSIVSIIVLLFNVVVTLSVAVIGFFLKRLINNIDKLNDSFHQLDKEIVKSKVLVEHSTEQTIAIKKSHDLQQKELSAIWRHIDSIKQSHAD